MLLAVDVGNTQTHVGLFRDEELLEHWRFHTARTATADELAMVLTRLLRAARSGPAPTSRRRSCPAWCPPWARSTTSCRERYLNGRGRAGGARIRKTGMPIRIDNPRELGADRLVNAVAAYDRIGGACIAVDFGTAINYDVVSREGEYLGGVISPGIEISLEALSQRAAALPKVRLGAPRRRSARAPIQAIQSGVVFGYAGQVDGLVARLREELGEEATRHRHRRLRRA